MKIILFSESAADFKKVSNFVVFFFVSSSKWTMSWLHWKKKRSNLCWSQTPNQHSQIERLFFVPSFNLSFTLRIIRYHHKRRTKQGTNILVDAVFILNTDNWQFHVGLNICHFHFVLFLLRLAMATIVSYYLTWFVFII